MKQGRIKGGDGSSRAEDSIQQEIFMWYNNTYCLAHHTPRRMIFSVPNEGKPELIRTGLYPGASDLLVFHTPSRPPLFVEVKTPSGIQSNNQKSFEAHVTSLGMQYYLVRSLEDFKGVIQRAEMESISNHSNSAYDPWNSGDMGGSEPTIW